MIAWALLSWLLAAAPAPVADTLPQEFDWNLPVKSWKPDTASFSAGSGRWTLVFFFSPSCGHCHKAWPVVEGWQKRYGRNGFQVEAVASGYANAQDMDFFAQDMGGQFVFPVFHDSSKALAGRMKVKSVPSFFLVDPQGKYHAWIGSLPGTLREIESTVARMQRWRRSGL